MTKDKKDVPASLARRTAKAAAPSSEAAKPGASKTSRTALRVAENAGAEAAKAGAAAPSRAARRAAGVSPAATTAARTVAALASKSSSATAIAVAEPKAQVPAPLSLSASEQAASSAIAAVSAEPEAPAPRAPTSTDHALQQAVTESAAAATRGLAELNGKVLDLMRTQTEATIDIWRSLLSAGSLSEAVRVQTSGFRRAYEAAQAHWNDIAVTAGRVARESTKPLQTVLRTD